MSTLSRRFIVIATAAVITLAVGARFAWSGTQTITPPARRVGDAFREQLDQLLALRTPAPLLATSGMRVKTTDGDIELDTIIIVGDSLIYRSLSKGALLHDQVTLFNRQMRRVAAIAPEHTTAWADSVRRSPSGVLWVRRVGTERAVAVAPGALGLPGSSSRAAVSVLWKGSVTSSALVSPEGYRLSLQDWSGGAATLAATGCRVDPGPAEGLRILRCRPVRGDNGVVARMYVDSTGRSSRMALTVERGRGVVNGRPFSGDIIMTDGDVLALGARSFVHTTVHSKALVPSQWINGAQRVSLPEDSTLRWMMPLATARVRPDDGDISLTLERESTRWMQQALDQVSASSDVTYAVALMIDASTGDIRAVAQSGTQSTMGTGRLSMMEPILYPGSSAKPIEGTAVLSQRPGLAALRMGRQGAGLSKWLRPSIVFDLGDERCGGFPLRLPDALACSHNGYFVLLLSQAVDALGAGLSQVFGVTLMESELDQPVTAIDPWRTAVSGLEPPSVLRPLGSRVLIGRTVGDRRASSRDVVSVALGARANRWSPIEFAQAWGRVVTGRALDVAFVAGGQQAAPIANVSGMAWHEQLLDGLNRVVTEGTGRSVLSDVPSGAWVLGKTGTLNEEGEIRAKTLLLALGERENRTSRRLGCGSILLVHAIHEKRGGSINDVTVPFAQRLLRSGFIQSKCGGTANDE